MSGARHDTIAHGNKTPLNHVVNSSPNLELHFARCFESGERGPAVNRVDFCPVSIRIWVGKTSGTMLARIDKFLIAELCQVHEYYTGYKNNFRCEPILEKYYYCIVDVLSPPYILHHLFCVSNVNMSQNPNQSLKATMKYSP